MKSFTTKIVSTALLGMLQVSCASSGKNQLAERIGFIGFTDEIEGAQFVRVFSSLVCDSMSVSPGPEVIAYTSFIKELKEAGMRYVTDVESRYETTTMPIPLVGGTSRCVGFKGNGYK